MRDLRPPIDNIARMHPDTSVSKDGMLYFVSIHSYGILGTFHGSVITFVCCQGVLWRHKECYSRINWCSLTRILLDNELMLL